MRFAEFADSWTISTLGEVCSYRKERRTTEKKYYVSTKNILQNYQGVELFDSTENISGDAFNSNDILISNIRPYLKKVYLADFNGACNGDVLVFKTKKLKPQFLHYILANDNFISYVMSSVKGSKMPRGDKNYIMQYSVAYPSEFEQEKISDFIYALTKRIAVQNKIIEDLKVLKKELMDFILNTNEFIEMSIYELIDLGCLSIVKASELKPFMGTREYLSTSSIGEDGIEQVESIISYIDRPSRASMFPIKDSIWFAKMKNTIKVYQSIGNDEERYILSTGFYGLLCNKDTIDPRWLLELFKSEYFNSQKDRLSEGTSISGIKDRQLADIRLKVFKNRKFESFHCDHIQIVSKKIELEKCILKSLLTQKQFCLNAMFI